MQNEQEYEEIVDESGAQENDDNQKYIEDFYDDLSGEKVKDVRQNDNVEEDPALQINEADGELDMDYS